MAAVVLALGAAGTVAARSSDVLLSVGAWLADWLCDSDALVVPELLTDCELLVDSDADSLVETDAADSDLLEDVDCDAADSLVAVDVVVDSGAADSLVDPEGAADWLVAPGAADSLPDLDGAVEVLVDSDADSLVEPEAVTPDVDSDAADSLVVVEAVAASDALADVDSGAADSLVLCDTDSVADSLVGPVLPGARTALPSVARVCVFAAVTSYETGVLSVMIYSPSSPRTGTDRTGESPSTPSRSGLICNDGRAPRA